MSVELLEDAFKIKKGECNHIPKNGKFCNHLYYMKEITEGYWLLRLDFEALPYDQDVPEKWADDLESIGWEIVLKENASSETSSEEIWIVKNL